MDLFAEISESVGFLGDVQGNVNVMGLVWENTVDDGFGLNQEVYTVWLEQINEEFDLAPGFDPYHILALSESFEIHGILGEVPIEVHHANINVVHAREAAPVKIWWFGANVIHGPDVFFEEVISNVHCRSTYANAVPYHFREVYESIDFEFHNIQPHPGITKTVKLSTGDLVNMRHSVDRQYYFNNLSADRLFAYDGSVWGWGHDIDDQFQVGDHAVRQLVFSLIDHLFPGDTASGQWKGGVSANENLFAWDKGQIVHVWPDVLSEGMGITDTAVVPILETLLETLDATEDIGGTNWINQLTAADRVIAEAAVTIVKNYVGLVTDGFLIDGPDPGLFISKHIEALDDGFSMAVGLSGSSVENHIEVILESLSFIEDGPDSASKQYSEWVEGLLSVSGVSSSVLANQYAEAVLESFLVHDGDLTAAVRKIVETIEEAAGFDGEITGSTADNLAEFIGEILTVHDGGPAAPSKVHEAVVQDMLSAEDVPNAAPITKYGEMIQDGIGLATGPWAGAAYRYMVEDSLLGVDGATGNVFTEAAATEDVEFEGSVI